ncbi:MAG: organomercurial lyase, partial [bacterium]
MLDRPVIITATEPGSGEIVIVEVDHDRAGWTPETAVVFGGSTDDPCCPSVDRSCGNINFFTTADAARTWAIGHPDVSGHVLDQATALRKGIAEFGELLH